VVSNDPINIVRIDEMPTFRKEWGNVRIKNEPFNYGKFGGDRYKLFNIIQAQLPTTEIHIKFVSEYETIYGYFGSVDCKVNDDEKEINLKVTTLDQYTPFLENRETEIKLFDESNIVANGKFDRWTGVEPLNWTKNNNAIYEQKYIADKTAISLKNKSVTGLNDTSGIKQTITNVLRGKRLSFSLSYALIGEINDREDLEISIYLLDTNVGTRYYLRKDGSWGSFQKFNYATNVLPLPYGSVNSLRPFSITANSTPIDGSIIIELYHYHIGFDDIETFLILSDVRLTTTAIQLNTIKVQLTPDNLVTVSQKDDKIRFIGKSINDKFFRQFTDSTINISDYFNGDGSPNMSMLASGVHSYIKNSESGYTYSNLLDFFAQKSSESYKFELSKLTVFHGDYRGGGKRNYYGIAEFSREEYYLADPIDWDENTDNLIPPAYDSGWDWTTQYLNGKRIWVRTPFNNAEDTWVLQPKITSLKTTHPEHYFVYHYSQTSTKQYPINGNSINIDEAIDLREIIRKVYCGLDESLIGKNVYSSFFWNDSQTEEIESVLYDNGTSSNYVSGELPNPLNNILAIHTYDLSTDPATDEEKSILKISGKKLIDDLIVLFPQLYWFIDEDFNLHIEHVKYFDRINKAKNLLNEQYSYITKYKQWEYSKEKMFSLQEYETLNSGYNDFKTSKVTFDKIVSNKRGEDIKGSYNTQSISTDIQYCVENPNSIDNGLILVCYDIVSGENIAKYGTGQKTGKTIINGDLSIASLLVKYSRYEGTYKNGKINDKEYTFEFTKRVKQGTEITFKGIFSNNLVLNEIGQGVTKSSIIDYENENTKVVFNYRYAESAISGGGDVIIDSGSGDVIERSLPTVITNPSYNLIYILGSWAIYTEGEVTYDGDLTVTESGICYGSSSMPTILDNKSSSGSGVGKFTNGVSGFTSGTYYVRTYATNSLGTSYGNQISFTISEPSLATVQTFTPSNIIGLSFTSGGNVISDGYSSVTEKGVCFGIVSNPTVSGYKTSDGIGTGSFTSNITVPTPNTWYFRAYAINAIGVSYGSEFNVVIS